MAKRSYISVKGETFDKLKAAAQKNGEHISTLVDALIRDYLDKRGPRG